MSKPIQGVFIGILLMAGLWSISIFHLSPWRDALVTAVFLIPAVLAIRYWNNREPHERG